MSEQIHFDLVSPEKKLFSEPADMVVIPGTEGEMGVGSGHASFVVALKAGVVQLYQNKNDAPRKVFVAGGFADVTAESCTVLAEEAIPVGELDQAAIEQDLKDFAEDIEMAEEESDKVRVQKKIALAKAKLSAVTGSLVS